MIYASANENDENLKLMKNYDTVLSYRSIFDIQMESWFNWTAWCSKYANGICGGLEIQF